MKVSLSWLKELVDYKLSSQSLADQLSLKSIGVKQATPDYLELDLTYNRGDLLSMMGVAREVAAITNSEVKFVLGSEYIWDGKKLPKVKIEVQDSKLCPLYCVAKIEGLKVAPSPKEWAKKLAECGIRSIDNVTDITNLMMLLYGQTMHAFDAAKVTDETMIVRLAKEGEKFTTLDGKLRNLTKEDLLITDPDGVLSLSGIMGGKNSEITENTNTILLEVAIFDPVSIRRSSQRLGLYSEASKRLQHGLTKTNLLQALSVAIKMYEGLGGKLTAITLIGNLKDETKSIKLTREKINSLTGVEIPLEEAESSLKKLGFVLASQGLALRVWKVTVPYWRLDINIEEDLIEEVARMYGYEKIEGVKLNHEQIPKLDQTLPDFIFDLQSKLKELGLTEVQTYSFYSTSVLEALGFTTQGKNHLIKVANPISSETKILRTDLWPNLLEVVGKNIKKGFKDIGIFEVGKVYSIEKNQPKENYRLSIALMNGTDSPIEELISLIKSLSVNLEGCKLNSKAPPEVVKHLFHPHRFVAIEKEDKYMGRIAEVHLRLLNKLEIEQRVAVLEINLEDLI